MTEQVNIGKQFSRYPAGRFPADGKYNGETFRKKFLVAPLHDNKIITILLDDAIDYGSSFLEEAFGGLVRIEGFSVEFLRGHIELNTEDEVLRDEIWYYIESVQDE